jgi:hypothetical protein
MAEKPGFDVEMLREANKLLEDWPEPKGAEDLWWVGPANALREANTDLLYLLNGRGGLLPPSKWKKLSGGVLVDADAPAADPAAADPPYGRSPGMVGQAEAIEKLVRPPVLASVSLKNQPSSILPGRVVPQASHPPRPPADKPGRVIRTPGGMSFILPDD